MAQNDRKLASLTSSTPRTRTAQSWYEIAWITYSWKIPTRKSQVGANGSNLRVRIWKAANPKIMAASA